MSALDISYLYEIDGDWQGNVIGYWCDSYVDKNLFFIEARRAHLERLDEEEIELLEVQNTDDVPFTVQSVRYKYYRLPTSKEIEQGEYGENEFIFINLHEYETQTKQSKAKYKEITVIEL